MATGDYQLRELQRHVVMKSDDGVTWYPVENPVGAGGAGGGGTEYTEGDTDTTLVGQIVMWEDTSDTVRAASATHPLPVEVITGGGGGSAGTEYTEGDTDASITGQAILWEDTSDTLRAVSASKPLPVSQTGTVTVADGGGSLTVDGTVGISGTVPVSDGGGALTVDGTVTVQDGGSTISVDDGAGSLTVDGSVSVSNFPATQDVNIVSGSSAGTEYTEGDVDATITGQAMLWEDTSDTLRAVSASKPLPVNVVSGSSSITTYTEDAVSGGGETGIAVLAVRRDSATSGVSADGDYAMLSVNSNGALRVSNAGGSSEVTEDTAAVADPVGPHLIARRRDTLTAAEVSADGDVIAVNANAEGAVWVEVANPEAIGGGTQYTEGATDASITGTAILWEDSGDTLSTVSSGTPLPVQVQSGFVDVSGSSVDVTDGGGSLTVDNAALAVTGGGVEASALRVTIANDSTGVVSVDDNGGSLTVDGTVAISGTVAVTQSGTWDEIGINDSGNSITVDDGGTTLSIDDGGGSITVDGTVAVTLAAGATAIAKAEDVASANADVGVPAMAVRKATPANTSGTDGDYEMLQMSAGRLWASATIDAALPAGTNAIGTVLPEKASSATCTSPAMSTTVATLASSNSSRKGLVIFNDTGQILYVKFGTGATTTDFTVKIPDQAVYELPFQGLYTGAVTGILSTGSGEAYVTEL